MLSNTKVIFYYVLLSFKRTKDIFRKPIEIELNWPKQNSIFFGGSVFYLDLGHSGDIFHFETGVHREARRKG